MSSSWRVQNVPLQWEWLLLGCYEVSFMRRCPFLRGSLSEVPLYTPVFIFANFVFQQCQAHAWGCSGGTEGRVCEAWWPHAGRSNCLHQETTEHQETPARNVGIVILYPMTVYWLSEF